MTQNKTIVRVALATGLLAMALPALAEEVTLFGTVDLAASHVSNGGGSATGMSQGGGNISRLGVRGTEDLGAGYGAGFWFETGLDGTDGSGGAASVGVPGTFWNRRATVSLTGPFGELRLGRDDSATFLNTLIFDPFLTNGVAGTNAFVMNGAPIQISNAISYFLPKDLGGFYGQLQYAWEPASVPTSKTYRGARAGYASGPLNVSASMARLGSSVGGKLKIANLGASYEFGQIKPAFLWAREKEEGGLSVRAVQLGVTAKFGAQVVRASVGDYRTSGAASANWRKFGVGYGYELSKRTMVYTAYSRINNSSGAARPVRVNSLSIPTNTLGHSAWGMDIGVRHFF